MNDFSRSVALIPGFMLDETLWGEFILEDQPVHGQHRASNELHKQGVFVSGSVVRSIWLRHNLENFPNLR